jgi:UDP-2,3-diacylglucosamine pyrophosphatase LpxH
MALARQVYVISDLHLGGEYGDPSRRDDRGFRLCTQTSTLTQFVETLSLRPSDGPRTELVINGDFVDFLAEQTSEERIRGVFTPFAATAAEAVAKLEAIVERDRPFFRALTAFLQRGHRLVVLLGNHDLELALPDVRRTLMNALEIRGQHDFHFIYDGEAYIVGDALIEHGNQYDAWNKVDHGALRRLRSRQSRGLLHEGNDRFSPPAGSQLVADVINAIKSQYRFVDLLKPETDAVLPLILALEPGFRRHIGRIAARCVAGKAASTRSAIAGDIASTRSGHESFGGDLAARPGQISQARAPSSDPLSTMLNALMPGESAEFLSAIDDSVGGDIASVNALGRWRGWARLLVGSSQYERRLVALRLALQVLEQHQIFERSVESLPEYRTAAMKLAARGFRYVIFGHTHVARHVTSSDTATYFNTGTWADLIEFPADVLRRGEEQAFREFVEHMRTGEIRRWINFRPTYVRLDVDERERVAHAELVDYEAGCSV